MYMIIHVDMDGVMCQLKSKEGLSLKDTYKKAMQDNPGITFPPPIPGFFENLDPIPGAIDAVNQLRSWADVFILTAPPVKSPLCYTEKRLWIEKHFDLDFCEKLIITAHKELVMGDILIDDYTHGKGQDKFEGRLIHFGSEQYPDWDVVLRELEDIRRTEV